MEPTTQPETNLFGDELPSIDDIKSLSLSVRSSEANMLAFGEKVDEQMSTNSAKTHAAVGIGLYILGRYDEAIERLNKAADCKEKSIYLGLSLRRRKRFAEAVDQFDASLKQGADVVSTSIEKAATYRIAGEYEKAGKELKSCSNFQGVRADYHFQLGRLHEVQGDYNEAVANYQAALELSGDHHEALFHLAYRCDLSGDEDAAIDYYQQVSSVSPVYVSALLNLVVLYEDREQFEKASQCVDLVLESHPNHRRAILFKKDIESSKTMFYDEEKEKKKSRKNQILETPLSDFELSVRSRNCLKKMRLETLGDLLNITEAELLSYKNFGETSLREIKVILESKNLRLGMALDEKAFGASDGAEGIDSSEEDEGFLSKPVEDLQLSVRAKKCIEKLDIHSVGELTRKTEAELLGCKNFGVTSLNEIKKALSNLGLSLRNLD
ncbi:MAG: tetratricopeptide repeat protein [Sedimentisphaerales bacterium]|nr:tetratricopeptide repeat protein [Sedimentisphaerales bacterium]